MDNKTIIEKRDALTKAVQSGESTGIIVSMLTDLKKGVVAKEETLRSTKIGAAVAKLKQYKSPEVARLASEVVRKWRDEIGSQRGGANIKRSITSPSTASPASTPTATKHHSASTVPPDQRSWKRDKVDIARTGQDSRNNCIGLLYDGLAHLSTTSPQDVLNVAVAVEQAIFVEFGPEDKDTYKTKVRSLYQNLKNKSNPQLRIDVVNGNIKPAQFVKMTHEQMKSAEQRAKDKQLENENMRNAEAAREEKSVSTALQCGKCGQKKVSYSQAQTRSADEPMTTFCECMNCGKRWKFS